MQQGRLADTVLPDQCHAVPLADKEGDAVKHTLTTRIGKRDILEFCHALRTLRRLGKREVFEACRLGRQHDPLKTVQLTLASACLFRLDACLIACDIFLGFLDLRLLFLIRTLQCCASVVLHAHIVCVVARVRRNLRMIELQYARRNAVEEIAVMRDQKHTAAIGLEKFLKPLDHTDVQMICRLIQKEKIRLAQESLCKTDARCLSAREMTDILGEIRLGESKTKRHAADAALEVVAVHRLEPCHEVPVGGEFLRAGTPRSNLLLHPLLLRTQCDEIGKCTAQFLVQCIVGKICLLLNITDRIGTIHHNLTAVVLLMSEKNPHECRLACAVCTDESYLVPALHFKVYIRKQRTYAVRLL